MLDSTATFVPHGGGDKRHLVHALRVLEHLNGFSEVLRLTDRMKDVDTGVTVAQATVVVGRNFKFVRVANFKQFRFAPVLVVNHEMALNHLFILHIGKFTSLLKFCKGGGSIAQKSTSVLVPRGLHQFIQSAGKGVVNAEGNNFAHGGANRPLFIIIVSRLINRLY